MLSRLVTLTQEPGVHCAACNAARSDPPTRLTSSDVKNAHSVCRAVHEARRSGGGFASPSTIVLELNNIFLWDALFVRVPAATAVQWHHTHPRLFHEHPLTSSYCSGSAVLRATETESNSSAISLATEAALASASGFGLPLSAGPLQLGTL